MVARGYVVRTGWIFFGGLQKKIGLCQLFKGNNRGEMIYTHGVSWAHLVLQV